MGTTHTFVHELELDMLWLYVGCLYIVPYCALLTWETDFLAELGTLKGFYKPGRMPRGLDWRPRNKMAPPGALTVR